MIKVILIAILILSVSVVLSEAKEPDWLIKIKKIRLLESTYGDVLKEFGRSENSESESAYSIKFELKSGTINVIFTNGECLPDSGNSGELIGWKVPEWRVEYIAYSPNKKFHLKKLNFDMDGFEKEPIFDFPKAYKLLNRKSGIGISVDDKDKVEDIEFFPAASEHYKSCEAR